MSLTKEAQRLEALATQIRSCVQYPLHASRTMAVPGDGPPLAQVMLIGEAPGREEDQHCRPFVGAAGRFLDQVLAGSGVDRGDLFVTNVVKCPPENNRTPRKREVDTCTSLYLFEQIKLVNPALIMVLGGVAAKKLLGVHSINEARGVSDRVQPTQVPRRLSSGRLFLSRRHGRERQAGLCFAQAGAAKALAPRRRRWTWLTLPQRTPMHMFFLHIKMRILLYHYEML
jgi:uracil-DNA glycosylase family 4